MTGAPLIGRDAELAALRAAIAQPPAVAFVEGEAGIGKSRLVAELATHPPAQVVVAACQPLPDPFPYGVLLDCLSHCGDRLREPGPVTGALRDYLPELADRLPPAPPPLGDPEAERHRVFRAFRQLLGALGRVVLVLEDLHWADERTRQVLRFVLADPPPGLSLVLTYRREDLAGAAPLGRALRVPPGVTGTHLVLRPFDVGQVRALINTMPGTRLGVEAVLRETAGIPFVVEQVLRADGPGVPVLVAEAVQERLRNLPAAARALAEAAAVLDVPELGDTLTAVAGEADPAHLVTLVRSAVLAEIPLNRYGFRYPLAARAVRESLPGPRRAELHQRALRVLSRLDHKPLARLAAHAKAAGLTGDWLHYSELAADAAIVRRDLPAAVELLSAVLADAEVRPAEVNRLATKLCATALTGLHDPAVLTRVEDLLADPRLTAEVRGEVRLWFGLLLLRDTGEPDRAEAEIAHAIDQLGDQPDRVARGMAVLAVPYLSTAPIAEHQALLDRVDGVLDQLPTRTLRTAVLATTLGGRLIAGDPSAWSRAARLPSPAEVTDPEEIRHLARAHCNLADACSWIGHHKQARAFLRTGLTLAARVGAPYVTGTAEATTVRLDWLTGQWSGLDERITELVRTYAHLPPVTTELHLAQAWLATARGDWARAESGFHAAVGPHPVAATMPVRIAAAGGLAALLLSRGDPTAAAPHAERGLTLLRAKGAWAWAGDVVPQAVDCYLATGSVDVVQDLLAELADGLIGTDAPYAQATLTACEAKLAAATGNHESHRLHQSAIEQHQALGLTYRATQLAEQAGATDFSALAQAYDALGATVDAARCRHRLRGTGVATPSPRGRRGYGSQLSPRERDVARLVAGGHTNREIAETLFLSRRTVEEYVGKVCRKLNVSSRNDIRL
ncbi:MULTISPECIES: AAA family ATPase [unclassified Crossiella]|uniref:ATP-binding protein n=1 Tax=unclassified Crossiella TaxID=2620835 RepID=UPI001FFFB193|nr:MULTISPECIES: AAA family ATPase [unclassified Crossiella]MCK2244152.1 AAA family ATPase [Crossiella sp. S99.2]MCK2257956.1 AAA family ATPase [Crossiella sp. S99.1]